jgi:zinc transport system substrate-binding protein
MKFRYVLFLLLFSVATRVEAEKIPVFVSVLPQAYLVERIGGEHVEVGVLVPPGRDPHIYEPTPKQMGDLSKARLYFKMWMPFERRLLEKMTPNHPSLRVENMAEDVELRDLVEEEHHDDHGHDEEIEGKDPHVWLGPIEVVEMAEKVAEILGGLGFVFACYYRENFEKFEADAKKVDAEVREILAPHRGKSYFVFHPAFGYFSDEYGLKQIAIEMEGKPPTPKQLGAIIEEARYKHAEVIHYQPQFDPKSVRAVAEGIEGKVVSIDPLAKDILRNFRELAEKICKSLK